MRVLISGSTGFVGRRLCEYLHRRGDALVALGRDPEAANGALYGRARVVQWQPPKPGPWCEELAQVDAVVNLAGEPIIGRWGEKKWESIRASRVATTRALVDAIERAAHRPRVLVNASAAGYYGETFDEVDESAPAGTDPLATLCVEWEKEALRAESLGVRVVRLRLGVVLGRGGGALAKMVPPFKLGLGGPMGSGNQWISWVAIDDVVGMVELALDNPAVTGPVNAVGPDPKTNRDFAHELGDVLHRPAIFPIPGAALRLIYGEGADTILKGQRVIPRRAIELGYPYTHATLRNALKASLGLES